MMAAGRTGKSIYNSVVSLAYCCVGLLVAFWSRRVFIDYLGDEILGLNSTALNLLQFLNLAELGIGTAVAYALYRPLSQGDTARVTDIVSLQGHIYRRIALWIIGAAVVISLFFPVIFSKMTLPLWYAYASFGVLLFSSLLSYFANYRQVVLSANQEAYKISFSYHTNSLIKSLTQIWLLSTLPDPYLWWLATEFCFSLTGAGALHLAVRHAHPYLRRSVHTFKQLRALYPEIAVKTRQLMFHRIAHYAVSQINPLIIFALLSLSMVTVYTNYVMITTGVATLLWALFRGSDASVGNLIAEGDTRRVTAVFGELFSVKFLVASACTVTLYVLQAPIVTLWLGEQYVLPPLTVCLIMVALFGSLSRTTVDEFIAGYGLFRDIWAPIAETLLNIGFSLLLGYLWGLNGILLGSLTAFVTIVMVWKPILLHRHGFRRPIGMYLSLYLRCIVAAAAGAGVAALLHALHPVATSADVGALIADGLLYFTAISTATAVAGYALLPEMRQFVFRLKNLSSTWVKKIS